MSEFDEIIDMIVESDPEGICSRESLLTNPLLKPFFDLLRDMSAPVKREPEKIKPLFYDPTFKVRYKLREDSL